MTLGSTPRAEYFFHLPLFCVYQVFLLYGILGLRKQSLVVTAQSAVEVVYIV